MSKKNVHLLMVGIGLFMLLLRPYVVYHITAYWNKDKNQGKTALMQRLIKKKDDHHECPENNVIACNSSKFSFELPVKQLSTQYFYGSPLVIPLSESAMGQASPMLGWQPIHRLCLLACFRI